MDIVLIVSMIIIFSPLALLLLADNGSKKSKGAYLKPTYNEDDLSRLYKLQNYEFWRDFGKQRGQEKTQ